ncbi:MAG: hypothetical protein IT249_21370 [Chitinophagaceae bacterium]|nr:hypothetical protein [Chitinophagaceae bacterium]
MKRFLHPGNLFLLIIMLDNIACNSPVDTNKIKVSDIKDSQYSSGKTGKNNNSFVGLKKEDIQYMDLMIADDAMVEIYYKSGSNILDYIEKISVYLKTKRAGIKITAVESLPENIQPMEKLYIHDTGDHRYVLYVSD